MLRINLLPIKASRRAQMGKRQILVYLVVMIVTVGLVALIHVQYVKKDTGSLNQEIEKVRKQVKVVQAKTGNVEHYKKLKRKYRKRRKAYRKVLAGCFCSCSGSTAAVDCTGRCPATQRMQRICPGPVLWMRELSHILSERWGPTLKAGLDPTRRLDYYDPNWDPTGLWLTLWEEQSGQVHMVGGAKANGDVAEFERRLRVSRYFSSVQVNKTELIQDNNKKVSFYQFDVTAAVVF